MSDPQPDMTPLDPRLLRLMRLHAAAASVLLLAGAGVAEAFVAQRAGLPSGAILLPVLAAAAYLVFLAPGRRYRAWGYAMDAEELHVRRGVWTRIRTVVPLERVQHIDVSQGPVERALGISRLILHTAGTLHSQIVVPGLDRETAESLRDEIRTRIRAEPA